MSAITISLIAFTCIFGGALLGLFLRGILPEHHLSAGSKDVIKLGTGMIATMAALVLGLMIASAKGTFDTVNNGLTQASSKVILLDRTMASYGPETREGRDVLRGGVITIIKQIWPAEKNVIALESVGQTVNRLENVQDKIRQLTPKNDDQRLLQAQALQISGDIAAARWLIIQQLGQSSIPTPFLVLLICWLAGIFLSFGLFTSRNATVVAVLFFCALSAASALFLILELDQPYGGLIKVSDFALLKALAYLGQ
ncbi:MAG: hypothetical protein ACLPX5_10185 [Dissulfurispiraceae bacterium]